MNKVFLTLISLVSLNLSLTAGGFPTLASLEATLSAPTDLELDPTFTLMNAVKAHDVEKAREALAQGARGEDITLLFPAHTGDTKMLELLTQYRRIKNLPLDQQTEMGESAVYLACKYSHSDTANFLLNAGASPFLTVTTTDLFHTKRDTALNIACKKGLTSTVKLLLEKGGHRLINTTNEDGKTCLHDLCRGEINLETLKLLLEHGGDANLQDNDGNTPFHYACNAKKNTAAQQTALELLMQYGADATILNKRGRKAHATGLLLDITNQRALNATSKEAREIKRKEKQDAATAAIAIAPTLKQRVEQILCSICMDEEEDKDTSKHITIMCNHSYHRACLAPWLARNPSCPLCRSADITEKQ